MESFMLPLKDKGKVIGKIDAYSREFEDGEYWLMAQDLNDSEYQIRADEVYFLINDSSYHIVRRNEG